MEVNDEPVQANCFIYLSVHRWRKRSEYGVFAVRAEGKTVQDCCTDEGCCGGTYAVGVAI